MNWAGIDKIYYDTTQEEAENTFLGNAAGELKTFLEQMSGKEVDIITPPPSPFISGILLDVDTGGFEGYSNETFHLLADGSQVIITGKSAIACRHGVYELLYQLRVRFFLPDDAWTVVPADLLDFGSLDFVSEPFYAARQLHIATGWPDAWMRRNRLWGHRYYQCGAAYAAILNDATGWNGMSDEQKRDYYLAHPDQFYPTDKWIEEGFPSGSSNWQLVPDNPDVITMTINMHTGKSVVRRDVNGDNLLYGGVSVTPNDGSGWNPPFNDNYDQPNDYVAITDKVFRLGQNVAEALTVSDPGLKIMCLAYTWYGAIPPWEFHENFIPVVCDGYNYTALTTDQQIRGYAAKGEVGVYDYTYVWVHSFDRPNRKWNAATDVARWAAMGCSYYNSEAYGGGFGAQGPVNYAISRLLWNPAINPKDIYDDFYTKAFGLAAASMKNYYEETDNDISIQAERNRFYYLSQALADASGDAPALARIRQLICYEFFVWKYHAKGYMNLGLAELQDFYTFVCKCSGYNLINWSWPGGNNDVEDKLRGSLRGMGMDDAGVDLLQNYTPPSNGEVSSRLIDAQNELGVSPVLQRIDPRVYNLEALGAGGDTLSSIRIGTSNVYIIFPSYAAEDITVRAKGSVTEGAIWRLYNPNGDVVSQFTTPLPSEDWITFIISTDGTPGNWILRSGGAATSVNGYYVEIPDRAAAVWAYDGFRWPYTWGGDQECYFYVPPATSAFSFTITPGATLPLTTPCTGKFTAPDLTETPYSITDITEIIINAPMEGLWKFTMNPTTYIYNYVDIKGILPLIGHDPQYLLKEAIVVPVNYNIEVIQQGNGTLVPIAGIYVVQKGEYIELKSIESAAGWYFDGWYEEGGLISYNTDIIVAATGDRTIIGRFTEATQHTLVVTVSPAGKGTTLPIAGDYVYTHGDSENFQAFPVEGYVFSHWEMNGQDIGKNNPIEIEILRSSQLIAVFNTTGINAGLLAGIFTTGIIVLSGVIKNR